MGEVDCHHFYMVSLLLLTPQILTIVWFWLGSWAITQDHLWWPWWLLLFLTLWRFSTSGSLSLFQIWFLSTGSYWLQCPQKQFFQYPGFSWFFLPLLSFFTSNAQFHCHVFIIGALHFCFWNTSHFWFLYSSLDKCIQCPLLASVSQLGPLSVGCPRTWSADFFFLYLCSRSCWVSFQWAIIPTVKSRILNRRQKALLRNQIASDFLSGRHYCLSHPLNHSL